MESQIITRFLESVGQKADVDLYLKLFRAQRRESFAIICPSARIVATALDPFHFDLRILTGLGLTPVVVLGLFEPRDADRQAARVHEWLLEDAVLAQTVALATAAGPGPVGGAAAAGNGNGNGNGGNGNGNGNGSGSGNIAVGTRMSPALVEVMRETTHMNTLPLLSLEPARDAPLEARFALLGDLAAGLESRKVVFLSTSAGLEREGAPPLSVVNLTTDYERLMAPGVLTRRHGSLLRHCRQLIEAVPHRLTATVVNPLQLLRELFTINGAGTLIRKGSRIESHRRLQDVDGPRLRGLIESAFGKQLAATALDRPVERIYVEESYLGAALLAPTPVGAYLTKFAVDRQAQGEGIGGDLWAVMTRDYPRFFWRARASNPITPWYVKNCDGMARFADWHVFWRGFAPADLEPAIRYALTAPVDFG